ncbi:pyridoxal-dependent decarboxylase, pyridoxal binding domain protein, partial [Vibrio parahaemolyticus V-223/04]
AHAANHRTR